MNSSQWKERKSYYEQQVRSLAIPPDPAPDTVKRLLSRIDALFTEARLELANAEVADDDIDRKIYVTEKENAVGRNDLERKRNAVMAVREFRLADDTVIDLWDVQRTTNERLKFIQSIIDILSQKQSRLITVSGVMKIEANLSPHGDISWNARG